VEPSWSTQAVCTLQSERPRARLARVGRLCAQQTCGHSCHPASTTGYHKRTVPAVPVAQCSWPPSCGFAVAPPHSRPPNYRSRSPSAPLLPSTYFNMLSRWNRRHTAQPQHRSLTDISAFSHPRRASTYRRGTPTMTLPLHHSVEVFTGRNVPTLRAHFDAHITSHPRRNLQRQPNLAALPLHHP